MPRLLSGSICLSLQASYILLYETAQKLVVVLTAPIDMLIRFKAISQQNFKNLVVILPNINRAPNTSLYNMSKAKIADDSKRAVNSILVGIFPKILEKDVKVHAPIFPPSE